MKTNLSLLFAAIVLISCHEKEVKRTYFENGNLEYEYEITNGILDGLAKGYFEDGTLKQEGSFKNNLRYDWHILYYPTGIVNQKTFYVITDGKEMVTRKMKYDKKGNLVSDFTFAKRQIKIEIREQPPFRIGDTLSVKIKIEDAKHTYSEVTLGFFDEYLNVLRYRDEGPIFVEGNAEHEMVMKLVMTKPGADTLTWLIRDFDYIEKTDSTGINIGEESYFGYPIVVESD